MEPSARHGHSVRRHKGPVNSTDWEIEEHAAKRWCQGAAPRTRVHRWRLRTVCGPHRHASADERSRLQAEEFPWGAAEGVTYCSQGAEPDGLGVAVLEDGQVGHGHPDAGR